MAVANCRQLNKVILVGAAGLRPPQGEIMDMYTVTARKFLNRNVQNPEGTPEFGSLYNGGPELTSQQAGAQWEAWEDARAATARIAWKPYMFTQSMPHLLENITALPTLILWGRQDNVMPLSMGHLYHEKIAGSRLLTFDNCGHMPAIEKPAEFIRAVEEFLD
jgi:pimeloyl-ACP methyl ester carboxylesterase